MMPLCWFEHSNINIDITRITSFIAISGDIGFKDVTIGTHLRVHNFGARGKTNQEKAVNCDFINYGNLYFLNS